MSADSSIPIIDVSSLYSDDLAECQEVAQELCEAAATVGFFYIRNHGIPASQFSAMFDIARRFFAAPSDLKRTVAISAHHRGCRHRWHHRRADLERFFLECDPH